MIKDPAFGIGARNRERDSVPKVHHGDFMLKTFCIFVVTFFFASSASAGVIDSVGTYRGTIEGVGVGFYTSVGVGLTDGVTCNGQNVVVLLYSNPKFKEMLAVLMSAQAADKNVRMYRLLDNLENFGGAQYCVVTSVSLGDFPFW